MVCAHGDHVGTPKMKQEGVGLPGASFTTHADIGIHKLLTYMSRIIYLFQKLGQHLETSKEALLQ